MDNSQGFAEQLPHGCKDGTVEWVGSRVSEYKRLSQMGDATVQGHGDRTLSFGLCTDIYRMLLYNYCLVQDVCSRGIVNTAVPAGLSIERYVEHNIGLYLSATSAFLSSVSPSGDGCGTASRTAQCLAVRHILDDMADGRDRQDGSSAGPAKQRPLGPQSRRFGGISRMVQYCCCPLSDSDDGAAYGTLPTFPGSRRAGGRNGCGHQAEENGCIFDILYPFATRLQNAKLECSVGCEREPRGSYTVIFLNTVYRGFLDEILRKLEALALRLKAEAPPPAN